MNEGTALSIRATLCSDSLVDPRRTVPRKVESTPVGARRSMWSKLRGGVACAMAREREADLAKKIQNCNKGLKMPNLNDGL